MTPRRRLIVGITGASGSIYGIRLLERLRELDVESHLVLSRWGARTLVNESRSTVDEVQRLATNGTFHFENCRVPAANLLGGEGLMSRLRSEFMWGSKAEAAATARRARGFRQYDSRSPGESAGTPAPGQLAGRSGGQGCRSRVGTTLRIRLRKARTPLADIPSA